MKFHPFEVSIPHIVYAALGGFVVFFGMFSLFIREKLYIGEACWAFLFGVVIGPYGANIFDPRSWGGGNLDTTNTIVLEFTRVVLAIGVFAIGVELPKAYMARHWKSLFFLLFPCMTWGWFVSAALIYGLIPKLNFLSSLAVAACLTPTDPILAAAVVGGKYADKHVPAHLRHLLAAESGCNDGAAYPFLFISLYLITDSTTRQAISDWFLLLWLYQVILGIVMGALIGFGFRYLMKFCERKELIDRQSYVAQYVSLAMLTIGSTSLLGSDDLLAAFACGTAFAWDGFFNKQTEEAVFSSVIDLLFNIGAFVFVGAWMPFNEFSNATTSLSVWRLIVIAILVLLLRRLPIMIALYRWIPDVKTFREAVFSGHFGPMGIGAIYISTLAAEQLGEHEDNETQTQILANSIQPIVAFMVLCSIAVHGLSIPFFSLGRRVHSVSRTWSRHDTFGRHASLPEWANQTRRVDRREDIVINRDRDVERGDLSPEEKLARSRRESMTVVDQHAESTDLEKEPSSGSQTQSEGGGMRNSKGWDLREEMPPDGNDIIAEWREGTHRIIERRTGPGDEVEVEVQKNAFGPGETHIKTFRVAEEAVQDTIHEIKQKLSHAAESIQHEAGQKVEELEMRVKNNISPKKNRPSPRPSSDLPSEPEHVEPIAGPGPGASAHEDEEEGWMSDRSADEAGTKPRQKIKSRPPKTPIPRPAAGGRRRQSFRRGVFPRPTRLPSDDHFDPHRSSEPLVGDPTSPPPVHFTDSSETDERGRRHIARQSSSSASLTSPSSLRHARIDSLRSPRSIPGSRDLSPARSVRFADEPTPPRSGAATPRILSPTQPSTPLPGSEAPSEDEQDNSGSGSGSKSGSSSAISNNNNNNGNGNNTPPLPPPILGQAEDDSPHSTVRFDLPDVRPSESSNYHSHIHYRH
ncbi:Sodium/hydrogen exchanger family-domain-containing protein [Abortiporus biennis]|nr:Sodium/hydrogen exchanger family-domain-containing protein [Abortiporus biennis]